VTTSIQTIRDACAGDGATTVFDAKPISRERFLAVRQLWSSRSERPFAAGAVASTSLAPKQAASKPKMAASQVLTVWPAALRLDQAAEYCGLSIDTFKEKCPVNPIEFTESSRGHRYLKTKLDEWLSSLDTNGSAPSPVRRFGEKINGR
jgi:hypothetical protein